MPFDYAIEPEHRLVSVTVTGKVSVLDIHDYYRRLVADPAFHRDFDQLIDFRNSSPDGILGHDVAGILDSTPFAPDSRRAYVVNPGINYGMARMTEAFASERKLELGIFENPEEARRWLAPRPSS